MDGRRVAVFDTTLRDGEQAPGNSLTPDQKRDLLERILATGVDYVEAGFPAASRYDAEFARYTIDAADDRATVSLFSRAKPADIDLCARVAGDAIDRVQVQILLTGSEIHQVHKRRMSRDEIVDEAAIAAAHATSAGFVDISLGLEDASRGSHDLLAAITRAGLAEGGTTVVFADTVGRSTPADIAQQVRLLRSVADEADHDVAVSVHCHNDLGLALGNTVAACTAGAEVVQGTFAGIGERAGNLALEELAALLLLAGDRIGLETRLDVEAAADCARAVLDVLHLVPWKHKPLLGDVVFSTAAGIHAAGMANDPVTYEFVDPALVGRRRSVVLNRASGRANVRHVLEEFGHPFDDALVDACYQVLVTDVAPTRFNGPAGAAELVALGRSHLESTAATAS